MQRAFRSGYVGAYICQRDRIIRAKFEDSSLEGKERGCRFAPHACGVRATHLGNFRIHNIAIMNGTQVKDQIAHFKA